MEDTSLTRMGRERCQFPCHNRRLYWKSVPERENVMINRYVALDIETTGLNPAVDRIIEVGMARIENDCITESTQHWYIRE